ncbi:cyclic nucleotide-binding domain-containing protein [Sinimarinibacterium sp. NLF-5-8]|uniref:cyclic nucleotide-binding domain-containing protein n=1 Tax=Sinimarinibacterium sp. NLF-5-8 TaxID=2698684 RepID=UPI00137C0D5C|nr:cyclic nucleotide-binding domain-containing protein [Sinimarinibacterium sp. NLF-5-8]QHS09493.1 cyclic nucleotide-binding domain-containing protein [Sinimarinibacterium sp. NLF-5-8]
MTAETVDPVLFARFEPLSALRVDSRQELAHNSSIEVLQADQVLFRAAEPATRMLFVMDGTVEYRNASGAALGQVTAGSAAARHALAHQSPRRVSAYALTPVRCLSIDPSRLDILLTWDRTGSFELGELATAQISDDWMVRLLQIRSLRQIPPAHLQTLFQRMQPTRLAAGEVVIQQGAEGDFFYVLLEGRCIVTREQPGNKPVRLAELEAGACFGEEALMSEAPRNASVTALTACRLMRLSKDDFHSLLSKPLAQGITRAQAEQLIASGRARWLDVRLPAEYQHNGLPGALNLPLFMLRMKLSTLDPSVTWITTCDNGQRSAVAAFVLNQKGLNAVSLEAGLGHA